MPIIVGSPRSGTTLLRMMIDSHPEVAIPPETGFLLTAKGMIGSGNDLRRRFFREITSYPPESPNWVDFGLPAEDFGRRLEEVEPFTVSDGFRLFYSLYAARFGKRRWGDKTPLYGHHMTSLERLLPEARFIHIVRDGRDAAVSLRKHWFSPGHDIRVQARYWRDNVLAGRAEGAQCRFYLEVFYENVLRNPESELRRICAFLDLEYHPGMLRYHERAAGRIREHRGRQTADGGILLSQEERFMQQLSTTQPLDRSKCGGWRSALTQAECRAFVEEAGWLLTDLGYLNGVHPGRQPDHA